MPAPADPTASGVAAWTHEIERVFAAHDLEGVGTPTLARLAGELLGKDAVSDSELAELMTSIASAEDETATDFSRVDNRALALGACAWMFMPKPRMRSSVDVEDQDYERFAKANRNKNGPWPKFDSLRIRQAWAYYQYKCASPGGSQQNVYSYKPGAEARTRFRDALIDAVERYLSAKSAESGNEDIDLSDAPEVAVDALRQPAEAATLPNEVLRSLQRGGGSVRLPARFLARHRVGVSVFAAAAVVIALVAVVTRSDAWPWVCTATPVACEGGAPSDSARSPDRPTDSPVVSAETAVASTAWGPKRSLVTRAAGSPGVELNSMLDNSTYGDESKFLKIKPAGEPDASYTNELVVQPGNDYSAMVWFDNDATGSGLVATKTKVRVAVPGSFKGSTNLDAFVSATNAAPSEVWNSDVIALSSPDSYAAIDYVPGTAVLHTNGAANGTHLDAPGLFGDGVSIGCAAPDGTLPPGADCEGWISFDFSVNAPNFVVTAGASASTGKASFQDHLAVRPKDIVELRVEYVNTGTTQQDNVTIKFGKLPPELHFIPGTVVLANSTTPGGQYEPTVDAATTNGINIGSYGPGANAYVRLDVEVEEPTMSNGVSRSEWINVDPAVTVYTSGGYKTAAIGMILLSG